MANDVLSLSDWGNLIKGADARGVYDDLVKGFYETDSLLTHMPMRTAPLIKVDVPFANTLPQPTTRSYGEPLTVKTIDVGGHEASVYLLGDYFTVDRDLARQPGTLGEPLKIKWELYQEGAVKEAARQFIKGDPSVATTAKDFAGLDYRLANPDTFKLRNDLVKDIGSAGSPTNLTSAATQADARKFIRAMEEGFAAVGSDDGEGCHIYGNQQFMGGFPDIAAIAGRNLMIRPGEQGDYGFRRKSFGRAGLHNIGYAPDGSAIIPNDPTDGTAVYIVNWKRLAVWQTNLMKINSDPPRGPHDNYWFRWGWGVGEKSSYPIYKLRYFKFV